MAESIRFKGVIFRRYPDAAQWAERSYFVPGIADREKGALRLHEEIWRDAHGDIPEGYEVHHADFDPLNNELSNLACVTIAEHKELHRERGRQRGRERGVPDAARRAATAWHRSEAARPLHVANGHAAWATVETRTEVCEQCDAAYDVRTLHRRDRFCSDKCKSAARRASGVDDEQRSCAVCSAAYTVNRYSRKKTCGRVCGGTLAAQRRAK